MMSIYGAAAVLSALVLLAGIRMLHGLCVSYGDLAADFKIQLFFYIGGYQSFVFCLWKGAGR